MIPNSKEWRNATHCDRCRGCGRWYDNYRPSRYEGAHLRAIGGAGQGCIRTMVFPCDFGRRRFYMHAQFVVRRPPPNEQHFRSHVAVEVVVASKVEEAEFMAVDALLESLGVEWRLA